MKRTLALSLLLCACGSRPADWEKDYQAKQTVGLDSAVAVLDSSLSRVLMLSSPGPLELQVDPLPVGLNVATTKASPDGKQLFVLSRGIQPRRNPEDQLPRLTIIDTDPPRVDRSYEFTDPLSGLVIDEKMEWAIAYVTPNDARAVNNPNEIILIDLVHPEAATIPVTIQSGGSSPKNFLFTDTLSVPNGEPRRFLVVQTERDVVLLDLSDAEHAESNQLRMEMPHNQMGAVGAPAQVVFHDAVDVDDTAELAVRVSGDSSVLLLALAPPANSDDAFDLKPNLLEVGGQASTIEFVRTNAGVRLLALVGSTASLVDPRTSNAIKVNLSTPFKAITRVTEDLDTSSNDVALLWSDQSQAVGLWNFGQSTATSRGLQTVNVGTTVSAVLDVPGTAFPTYKILESSSGDFFVLDLATRESAPMDTNGRNFSLSPAPDGRRLWAYLPGGLDFASIDLDNLHAASLTTERPITGVFDLARPREGDEGRTVLALHEVDGDVAATLLNALDPDSANTRFYSGLVYQGIAK